MIRKTWVLAGMAILFAVAAIGGAVVISRATQAIQAAQETLPNTVTVKRGKLSAAVSLQGTLTYRARSDGSPYPVVNQALGRYTELPDEGDAVACGDVVYRVDSKPVLLLCGTLPAYRDLYLGDVGSDVAQLNRNLHTLGCDAKAGVEIDPDDTAFTLDTLMALAVLRQTKGFSVTGFLGVGDAVFLPESVRIAKVAAELGGSAQPGALVASATSAAPEVQVDLAASQQSEVKAGQSAQITLPGNRSVAGMVDRLGRVAQFPDAKNKSGAATIPAYIRLDDSAATRGLDQAPVQVEITTDGVENALSVPVTSLIGKSGGGFAVEVVRGGGQRELVPVKLGLFDTASGRVEVQGELGEGDQVVVPSV